MASTKLWKVVALIALGLLVLGSCGRSPAGADKALVIRLISDPGTLDPQMSPNGASAMARLFAYDRVLDNSDGRISPHLATRWSVDGRQVRLWIRKDVTCSDGHRLTASDVAANFRRITNAATRAPNAKNVFGDTDIQVSADDDDGRVEVQLSHPYSDILYGLANVYVVCPAGLADLDRLKATPAGTGPYVLTNAVRGDRYVYERRDNYRWPPGGGEGAALNLPPRVVLKVVENESTAANMLIDGSLDIARITGFDRLRLEKRAGVTRRISTPALFSLFYNQKPRRPGSSLEVRRALTAAVDRRALAIASVGPHVKPADAFQAPAAPCYRADDASAIPTYDPARARRLFVAAGYRMQGRHLVRDNQPLRIKVLMLNDLALGADLLVDAWTAQGVQVAVQTTSEEQVTQTTFLGGDWDVVLTNTDATTSGRNAVLLSGEPPPKGINIVWNHDPDYDRLIAVAGAAAPAGACRYWSAANRRLLQTVTLAPVFYGEFAWFSRDADFTPVFNEQAAIVPTSLRAAPRARP